MFQSHFPDLPTFVTHLECSYTGERQNADQLASVSAAGKPLLVRYDLKALAGAVSKDDVAARPGGFWRYREFLPVRHAENILSLGEVTTPLIPCPNIAENLLVKDEGILPTGSFKARGLALAVSMAKELGVTRMAIPTNGNAGAAMTAYASRAGIVSYVFCPSDTPDINMRETQLLGAKVVPVDGLINDCGKLVAEDKNGIGWFNAATLREPYRIEGKKTMGLELAEQLGWELPDVIFYPTGGGTGLIGMWKAFAELAAMGWIGDQRPNMVAVQATGCAPIVKAWQDGADHAELWPDAHTIAAGIRVPVAIGDFLILNAVRDSGGYALAAPDDEISAAQAEVAAKDGMLMGPEGATTYAALRHAVADGRVGKFDQVVLFNCGPSLKYPMPPVDRALDRHQPIDYAAIAAA